MDYESLYESSEWLQEIISKRKALKPPSCSGCPQYDGLMVCHKVAPGDECDVLFLAPSPSPFNRRQEGQVEFYKKESSIDIPFSDDAGRLVKNIAERALNLQPEFKKLRLKFWYGTSCQTWKPTKTAADKCGPFLSYYLSVTKPKVIIPLGTEAMKSLGMVSQIKAERGRLQDVNAFGVDYKVIPTFHPFILKQKPGTLDEFTIDIVKGYKEAASVEKDSKSIHELTTEYRFPKTLQEVTSLVDEILAYTKNGVKTPLAVDIETNSLKAYLPKSKSITISFAWDEGKATTIILDHKQAPPEYLAQLPLIKEQVQRLLSDDRPKIGQNFKFDWKFLVCREGYTINNYSFDTQLVEHALNEDRSQYKLKAMVRDYFPEFSNYEEATDAVKSDDTFRKNWFPKFSQKMYKDFGMSHLTSRKGDLELKVLGRALVEVAYTAAREVMMPLIDFLLEETTFEDLPIHELCKYAGIDADMTWRLAKRQIEQLKIDNKDKVRLIRNLEERVEDKTAAPEDREKAKKELSKSRLLKDLISEQIIPMSVLIAEMEYKGFRLDIPKAQSWVAEAVASTTKLEDEIYSLVGNKFVINSPSEVARVLYSQLGLPIIKQTDKGAPSTDSVTLDTLLDKTKNPILEKMIQYREAKSCFEKASGYKGAAELDGYVHSEFYLSGTTTGRLSSGGGVNLQNIISRKTVFGKKLKELFIPSDPDTMNIGNMDLSSAEVIILTAYASDKNLTTAILNGQNPHAVTASKIYNIPYDEFMQGFTNEKVDPKNAKPHPRTGLLYSEMRSNAKAITFLIIYGGTARKLSPSIGVSLEVAQTMLDDYFSLYPGVKRYMDITVAFAKQHGYIDTYFGRKRRFPMLKHDGADYSVRNQAINFKIQSTAADLINAQMLELKNPLRDQFNGRIIAQVHDAIVFEYDKTISNDKIQQFFEYYITKRIAEKYTWMSVPMLCEVAVGPNYGNLTSL